MTILGSWLLADLLAVLGAWLLADLLTGAVHWFEDRYMDKFRFKLSVLDSIARDNDLHHQKPTAMLLSSGWVNMRFSAAVGWPIAALLWLTGFPYVVCFVPFFAGFGNLIHRWGHTPKAQLPRWIRGLQEFGIFISQGHHDSHHRSMDGLIPKHIAGYRFCPMTDLVNPVVDALRFWKLLEFLLACVGLETTESRGLK